MIRQAKYEDIPKLKPLAEGFCKITKALKHFNFDCFDITWTSLLNSKAGVILLYESDKGVEGAICGVAYPDPHTGRKGAIEFAWFVDPQRRGCGARLYNAFEKWAREKGCLDIRMIALADSMAEELERFYIKKGFERIEVHYGKELL